MITTASTVKMQANSKSDIQVPCPRCGKPMLPEGPPFYGLKCECGMGATYSFAVRIGAVPEIRPGDRQRAIDAYKERQEIDHRIQEYKKATKIPGSPKRFRHIKIPKEDYPILTKSKAAFLEKYNIEGEIDDGTFLMCLAELALKSI